MAVTMPTGISEAIMLLDMVSQIQRTIPPRRKDIGSNFFCELVPRLDVQCGGETNPYEADDSAYRNTGSHDQGCYDEKNPLVFFSTSMPKRMAVSSPSTMISSSLAKRKMTISPIMI